MPDKKDYTLVLDPKSKPIIHIAGSYDTKTKKPYYEIEIEVPSHVRNQVKVEQVCLGTDDDCQWAYKLHNQSEWIAWVTIKKDGVKLINHSD